MLQSVQTAASPRWGRRYPANAAKVVDLNGRLVVPGLVDAHQHLDKSRTRRLIENPSATLQGASAGYRALAAHCNAGRHHGARRTHAR